MNNFAALTVIMGIELLALLAFLGDRRFALHEAIPVYWRKGKPSRLYIKRRIGLAVFPVAGTVLLVTMAVEGKPVYLLAFTQLSLAALNMLYFRAIDGAVNNS